MLCKEVDNSLQDLLAAASYTVVSKRFANCQQMQWTRCGIQLVLQTRTSALDGMLRLLFKRWHPGLANDVQCRLAPH